MRKFYTSGESISITLTKRESVTFHKEATVRFKVSESARQISIAHNLPVKVYGFSGDLLAQIWASRYVN